MATQRPMVASFEMLAKYMGVKSDGAILDGVDDVVVPTVDLVTFFSLQMEMQQQQIAAATVPVTGGGAALTGAGGVNGTVRFGPPANGNEIWMVHGIGARANALANSYLALQMVVLNEYSAFIVSPVGSLGRTHEAGVTAAIGGAFQCGYWSTDKPVVLLPGMVLGYVVCQNVTTGGATAVVFDIMYRKLA